VLTECQRRKGWAQEQPPKLLVEVAPEDRAEQPPTRMGSMLLHGIINGVNVAVLIGMLPR
jgi:hypothetical protein